ncbi:hypothetical protein ZOSMA_46G00760, partial [Zostera marina]
FSSRRPGRQDFLETLKLQLAPPWSPALAALGLKVGGTVKQRADRLFLTK